MSKIELHFIIRFLPSIMESFKYIHLGKENSTMTPPPQYTLSSSFNSDHLMVSVFSSNALPMRTLDYF